MTARQLRTLEALADGLRVTSLANGNMLVEISYRRSEHLEPEQCGAGVMTRMAIAREIEATLLRHMGRRRNA